MDSVIVRNLDKRIANGVLVIIAPQKKHVSPGLEVRFIDAHSQKEYSCVLEYRICEKQLEGIEAYWPLISDGITREQFRLKNQHINPLENISINIFKRID
jgi:hypothetical protein